MSIATYSDLTTAAANWLARGDLTARIPEFVALAEAKFQRSLFVRQMEQRSTATVDTTSSEPEFISLPSDFQTMRRIRLSSVTGKPGLGYMSGTQIDEFRTNGGNTTGQPLHFSIIGDEIELAPTPDDDYTIEMVYRKTVPALSDASPTNWLLSIAPDVYLYSVLMESAPFIKDDERLTLWATLAQAAIKQLNDLSSTAQFNAGPAVIRTSAPTP